MLWEEWDTLGPPLPQLSVICCSVTHCLSVSLPVSLHLPLSCSPTPPFSLHLSLTLSISLSQSLSTPSLPPRFLHIPISPHRQLFPSLYVHCDSPYLLGAVSTCVGCAWSKCLAKLRLLPPSLPLWDLLFATVRSRAAHLSRDPAIAL